MRNLIAIFVEGIGTSLVGGYGANTAHTPCLDRLAMSGLVVENCFVDSVALDSQLASLWTGRHALQPEHGQADGWTLWKHLSSAGAEACLITDCPETAAHAERLGCENVIYVEPTWNHAPCLDSLECSLFGVFAAAAEELSAGRGGLMWVHSRGLKLPWDAPAEVRRRFTDPEDPDPPLEVGPPQLVLTDDSDPDIVTGWMQVAAAQAAIVDDAIAALWNIVARRADEPHFAWVFGSLGGVSLGESRHIGFNSPRLHTEQLRLPLILLPAGWRTIGGRCSHLFQLPDVCASILDVLGAQMPGDLHAWGSSCLGKPLEFSPEAWPRSHQLAVVSTDAWQWLRCPAWGAVLQAGQTLRLFVKPDDRWEVTDVANRRLDVGRHMDACYAEFISAVSENRRGTWPALAEELTSLLR
jgi:hypothetical protein